MTILLQWDRSTTKWKSPFAAGPRRGRVLPDGRRWTQGPDLPGAQDAWESALGGAGRITLDPRFVRATHERGTEGGVARAMPGWYRDGHPRQRSSTSDTMLDLMGVWPRGRCRDSRGPRQTRTAISVWLAAAETG